MGQGLLKRITEFNRLVVFSRSAKSQLNLRDKYKNVEFVLGDLRDLRAVKDAVKGMDIVIHAGAIKYVELAEEQPRECVLTNVIGSMNVVEAVRETGRVDVCIGISTDKAVYPINAYGASKHLMEKLFLEANKTWLTKFCCYRGGNIKGSTGSVYDIWNKQKEAGAPITVTDPEMTRYFCSINETIDTIFYAIDNTTGGEIFIKSMEPDKMGDLADEFSEGKEWKTIGARKGESMHEELYAKHEEIKIENGIMIIRG